MSLLRSYRRYWSLIGLALLTLPLVGHVLGPKSAESSPIEHRTLAKLPSFPATMADIQLYPKSMDAYLNDHFGVRNLLLRTNFYIRYVTHTSVSPRVAHGRDGWLFLTDDNVLRQVTGELERPQVIRHLVNLLAKMQKLLTRDRRQFVVAIAPNKHSVYANKLTSWSERPKRRTEYDLFLAEMAQAHVPTVDLRPALRAAASKNLVYYPTGTHWNRLGALIAYNSIMTLAGMPDWRIDPLDALGPSVKTAGGELARFLGVQQWTSDTDRTLRIPDPLDSASVIDNGHQGFYDVPGYGNSQTILVLGDSFSRNYMRPYFARHASHVVWTHHDNCRFDWSVIERYKPDIVIFILVERGFGWCAGRSPANMPD